ncbi:MAG: hypothetical protein IPM29_09105 [Planctomycetes bacterium]|nr:hypothetical protein [Planctomycetota bacterium]
MSDGAVRRWFLGAVLAAFAAGGILGLVAADVAEAVAARDRDDPDQRYVRQLTDVYGLDAKQERLVRLVLRARDLEHRRILLRDVDRLPAALRDELEAANLRMEERIKSVLTDEQRTRFLHDSRLAPREPEPR